MDLSLSPRPPVALLVDGENLPRDRAAAALRFAAAVGDVRVKRVYGAVNHIAGWEELGFRLVATRPGKNAADMLLCVEAAILALRDGFGTLLIASSDRDFSYLAEQLRELGVQVIGLGQSKAPKAFRATCSRFVDLGEAPAQPLSEGLQKPVRPETLEEKVGLAIRKAGAKGALIASLNPLLRGQGVKISETPEGNWRKWLAGRATMFDCDPKGPEARVRLRKAKAG